jgi:hypothetical protein
MLSTAVAIGTAAAVLYAATRGPANLTYTKAPSGKDYLVQDLPDREEAAKRMESLQNKIEKLFSRYRDDPANSMEPRIQMMLERFKPQNMCESDMRDSTTSYSENKGDRIVVCLRQKTKGYPFVEENTVMFVMLHELAHLMTYSIGHTPEFWANFRRILNDAMACGVYQNADYNRSPVPYCGIEINSNPLS